MKIKICHISDTHGLHQRLTIPKCDILIHSGDITNVGEPREIADFFKWFNRQIQTIYRCNLRYEPVNKPIVIEFDTDTKEVTV